MRMFPKIDVAIILFTLFVSEVTCAEDGKVSRRILEGDYVNEGFHFMVYLTTSADPNLPHNWLCGGVIIHAEFILTSAACISEVDYFYVIAGTYTYYDIHHQNVNRCVRNTKRRAIWKCVTKDYDFIKSWSANDIAVVKVEKPYEIGYLSPGCYFAPSIIKINNIGKKYERRGMPLTTAGWGSVDFFVQPTKDNVEDSPENSRRLLSVNVTVIQNERCRSMWEAELESNIEKFMICTGIPWAPPPPDLHINTTPDLDPEDEKNKIEEQLCESMGMKCTKLVARDDSFLRTGDTNTSTEDYDETVTKFIPEEEMRKRLQEDYEVPGICQNDHGGPLLGTDANGEFIAVGVISGFLLGKDDRCTEPFLYTSVFYNHKFITCAVNKELEPWRRKYWHNGTLDGFLQEERDHFYGFIIEKNGNRWLRPRIHGCRKPTSRSGDMYSETRISWRLHPDGPSENEKMDDLEIAVKKYLKLLPL